MTKSLAFFLPHHSNNHKAHAIKAPAIFSYIIFLILLQISLRVFSIPGVHIFGVSTSISTSDIINLTNERRISQGVRPVMENALLNAAAAAKAKDMIAQNYWAHFAPDGKSPWGFISQTGYKYSVAGENLARDFDTSSAVVVAWMNSASHKQNLLDNSFTEIGVAVTEGNLNGVNGSLVVQMFATPANLPSVVEKAKPAVVPAAFSDTPSSTASAALAASSSDSTQAPIQTPIVSGGSAVDSNYQFNPYLIIKTASLAISGLLVLLILIDIFYIRRNRISRALHHSFAHMFVFSLFAVVIVLIGSGSIL